MTCYTMRPSALTFLYEGCKRCFYLQVVHDISQPSIPLPSIFSKIASLLKEHYDGKRTEGLSRQLPPGTVRYGERYVRSQIIQLPGMDVSCYINGRFDIVVEFDNGGYGVIDFKTGNPNEEYWQLYGRQLHAYAYALEHPAPTALSLNPVTKLGLLYLYPSSISQRSVEHLAYEADVLWVPIEKDEDEFLAFMREVLGVLAAPEPPPPSATCTWCKYLKFASKAP